MTITNRDLELFKKLSTYGMLSTKQINFLCFNSIASTTVLRRLRLLEENKYVQRILGLESKDLLWALLPKGAEIALVEIPKRHWSKNLLEHDFKLLSLRLALEESGLTHSWMPEHLIRANIYQNNSFRAAKEKLIPDGFMGIEVDGKRLSLAIELELTLKNKDKLRKTLSRYQSQKGIAGVWYIAPTTSLLNSILEIWKSIGNYQNSPNIYLSVLKDVMTYPLKVKVFGNGNGRIARSLWAQIPAHPIAHSVSSQNENREQTLIEISTENHAPIYQNTG